MHIRQTIFAALFATAALVATSGNAMAAAWTPPSGTSSTFKYDNGRDNNGLFGSPSQVTSTGFVFEPTNFIAISTNNSAGFATDTMKVNVSSLDGSKSLTKITLDEFGDFSINNGGGVKAQGAFFVRVLDDTYAFSERVYSAELVTDPDFPLNGEDADGLWDGNLVINLPAPASKISITFNNTLQASSDQGGSAFIQKKGIEINFNDPVVPEPTSIAAIVASIGFVAARRRKA